MKSSVEQDASERTIYYQNYITSDFFFLLCRIISHSLFEGNKKNCISSLSSAPYLNKYLGRISWDCQFVKWFFPPPSPACFQFFAYKEMIMLPLSHPFLFSLKLELSVIFSPWYHFLGLWSKASYSEIKAGDVEMTQDYWNYCDFSFLVLF